MSSYVLGFQDIDQTNVMAFGGKGANLGGLCRIEGVRVPAGFCISTEAFKRIIQASSSINQLIDQLSLLLIENREAINTVSADLRRAIEAIAIPEDIQAEIADALAQLGERNAYAVRSSATAEDLPTASFAGQQDTYLNIIGTPAILRHVSKCWASLFTERAVTYRLQHGFDHRDVYLAVVVQKMIFPEVSGIAFTADPVTSNRKVVSIDASFGLGEALVAGLVNADVYKVRSGQIIDKKISAKRLALYALADGGTAERQLEPDRQTSQALSDQQILQLEQLGRTIERHFGRPQDIEWCLADGTFHIVQSRPITTLYPIPEASDQENRAYLSVGHQQMMTDPMKPLGLSFFLLTTRAPMRKAGGRLFVDITQQMASANARAALINGFGKTDPLIKDALITISEREDFIKLLPDTGKPPLAIPSSAGQPPLEPDPAIVADLIERHQQSLAAVRQAIQALSGPGLFDFILEDLQELKKIAFDPQNMRVILAGMDASAWINQQMHEWLGEKNVADTLSQSVPNNITSEMGLALLDVADAIRPYPAVIDYIQHAQDDGFLEGLATVDGGQAARQALAAFLDAYGMRCAGEIDITKPRWSEKPTTLVPVILTNIKNFEPGASARKFEQGRLEALKKAQELLDRLSQLPDADQKIAETQRRIDSIQAFVGYREYPKYGIVSRYFIYKQALLKEAERLAQAGVLHEKEDAFYLAFEEFHQAARSNEADHQLISSRKDEHTFYEKLTPPRVITSDGEIIVGAYKRDHLPSDALVGLGVSAGVIEGRARVILKIEAADLEDGDILVTTFTDPSWTPLFVAIKGLVTEVGGLMTHGAVIAREYGLPAVVSVDHATKLIKDGQRIRLHGTEGYVELL